MVSIFSPEVAGTNSLLMKRPVRSVRDLYYVLRGLVVLFGGDEGTSWLGVFGAVWGCEFEGGGHGFLGAMC